MGGIKFPKENVSSIYQWRALLQHLLQKQFYPSDNVHGSINPYSNEIVHVLSKSILSSLVLFFSIRKIEVILKGHSSYLT